MIEKFPNGISKFARDLLNDSDNWSFVELSIYNPTYLYHEIYPDFTISDGNDCIDESFHIEFENHKGILKKYPYRVGTMNIYNKGIHCQWMTALNWDEFSISITREKNVNPVRIFLKFRNSIIFSDNLLYLLEVVDGPAMIPKPKLDKDGRFFLDSSQMAYKIASLICNKVNPDAIRYLTNEGNNPYLIT